MKIILQTVILILFCSCSSPRDNQNAENIKKITIGMKIADVKNIMGNPDEVIIIPYNEKEYDFIYSAPSKYGDDFHIFCSREDSSVLRLALGDY